jgi:hypothetical protein
MMARSLLTFVVIFLWATTVHAKLDITNIQAAYGPVGPVRESPVYYPGDEIVFRYLLTGVGTNARGEIDVDTTLQITDASGKNLFQKTTPTKAAVALGGGSVPGTASVTLGRDVKRGAYRLSVTAKDNLSGQTASFERQITLHETTFTSVNQRFFMDPGGKVPGPAAGLVGQSLYYRLGLIGFDRSKGRIEARLEVEVLDEGGKKVLTKPSTVDYKNEKSEATRAIAQLKFNGFMVLNRAGNFILRFKFADAISGQHAQFEVPLKVTDP